MQRMTPMLWLSAAAVFSATLWSASPKSVRRSECPMITHGILASASCSTETSVFAGKGCESESLEIAHLWTISLGEFL